MYRIEEYVDIKEHSSLQIGGKFRYYVELENKDDITSIYQFSKEKKVPIFILGGGSNVIFSDGILDIVAIKIKISGFEIIQENENSIDIKVGSGEIWDNIVAKTVDMNLLGLESLSLIPGTVGATPVQNVGAYGSEVKDTIVSVEVFDIKEGTISSLSNEDCKFGYRDSIFKNEAKGKYIITSVVYRLSKLTSPKVLLGRSSDEGGQGVRPSKEVLSASLSQFKNFSSALLYPGVKKYFEEKNIENPTLKEIRTAIINIRNEKLPNPNEIPNVGSFFKNPIISNEIANQIKFKFPDAIFFPVGDGLTKIPAGWLIENSGLKGKSFGNISVYSKNALILVNNGNATKDDITDAKNKIIEKVSDKFGIVLEQEPENI